jgi:hypothetical protein
MTDEKKTIVSISAKKSKSSDIKESDPDLFFRDPESLKEHMKVVASVDASHSHRGPDKPATRVSSLDSFQTNSDRSSFALKRSGSDSTRQEENVRAFSKPNTSKPRKKQ